jgi:hypothetical protein
MPGRKCSRNKIAVPASAALRNMETPAEMCARLVTALEDLAAQESICLQTRNFAAVVAIQDRAQPLVEHLTAHAADLVDPTVRARIAALIAKRNDSGAWLTAEIERTRQQLHAVEGKQRRVARIAPAYAYARSSRRQLSAVG